MRFHPISNATLIAICATMLVCGKSTSATTHDIGVYNSKKEQNNSCIFAPVQATSAVKINLNLNSNSAILSAPFNSMDNTTYNFHTNSDLYDSLGVKNSLQIYYVREEISNAWTTYVFVNDTLVGTGKLQFNTAGVLTMTTGLDQLSWVPLNGATAPQHFSIDLSCATLFGSDFEIFSIWQNGHSTVPSFHAALNTKYFSLHKNTLERMCLNVSSNATTIVKLHINLNANNSMPTNPFNPEDMQSYNYKNKLWVYDSLGAPYKLSLYYVKNSANDWKVYAYMYHLSLGSGQMLFNSNGTLSSVMGLDKLSWLPYSGANSPQEFSVDMTCSTQYGAPNVEVESSWQDGEASEFNLNAHTLRHD